MIPLFRKHRDKRKDGTGRTSSIQHDQRCNRRRSKGLAVCPSSNFLAALLVPLLMFLTLSALLPAAVNAAEDSSDLSENARGNDESRLLSNLVFGKDSGANTDTDDLFYFSMSADRIQSNMDEDTVSRTHGSNPISASTASSSSFNVASSGHVLLSETGSVVQAKDDQIRPEYAGLHDADIGHLIKATLSKDKKKRQFIVLTPEQSSLLYSEKDNEDRSGESQQGDLKKATSGKTSNDNRRLMRENRNLKGKGKGTSEPSSAPTSNPSKRPSQPPTMIPSNEPSRQPSFEPSDNPSVNPSDSPSECIDEPEWVVGGLNSYTGLSCKSISSSVVKDVCQKIESLEDSAYQFKTVSMACCECGGGNHQSSTPSTSNPTLHAYPSAEPSTEPTACTDEPGWFYDILNDGTKLGCTAFEGDPEDMCTRFGKFEHEHKTAALACCLCGGGDHQSVTPSSSPSLHPSSNPSINPSVSSMPSKEPSMLPSGEPSVIPSDEPSQSPSESSMPSSIPSMSWGTQTNGEPCNYDRECLVAPFFRENGRRRMGYTVRRIGAKSDKDHKKHKSHTSNPSGNPSGEPSRLPSDKPSLSPSDKPSLLPSDTPSSSPSDQPSLLPSNQPSDQPSLLPSNQPSLLPSNRPSDQPSLFPSDEPSLLPSDEPSIIPTSIPSSIPSLSLEPSNEPSNTRNVGTCKKQTRTCETPDLTIRTQDQLATGGNRRRGESIALVSTNMFYVGSYGNSLNDNLNDGSYDQDYLGGHLVDRYDSNHIILYGNAWKAFELVTPYKVTKNTRIAFDFTVFKEAQGHAICLDNDRNEDTFGGTYIRCLMLGGKQFSKWDHVKKLNLVDLRTGEARQSSTLQGGDASKAVDGNIKQAWSSVPELNSVSCTPPGIQSWWEFEFKNNDMGNEFEISEIIIYSGLNCPACENLTNFRVSICGLDTHTSLSSPSETPSTSTPPSSLSTQTSTTWPDACDGTIYTRINDDIIYADTINQDGIVIIPVKRKGAIIRITLEGRSPRVLALGEVQVIGTLTERIPIKIDLNVFDLFPAQDAKIRYIGFVQDDDEFPNTGSPPHLGNGAVMSEFNDMILYESDDALTQLDVVWSSQNPQFFNEQGNARTTAEMPFHSTTDALWKVDVIDSIVRVRECYRVPFLSFPNECRGVQGKVPFDDHEPMSIAMSPNISTIVVGYPEFILSTPSTAPSEAPSISTLPTKAPTKSPTKSPTKAPTKAPSESPAARRRLSESEQDKHGVVVIYVYNNNKVGFPHATDWTGGVQPFKIYGILPGADFGAGVAVSDDALTVAVGSPERSVENGTMNRTGMVQVYQYADGSWNQKGADILPDEDNIFLFGYRVGLSQDGNSLAVSAPNSSHSSQGQVGALFVFDWDSRNESWIPAVLAKYGSTSDQHLGVKGIVTDPQNLLLHAVDIDGNRHSFKLEGTCSESNAVPVKSILPHQIQCACLPGFLASNGGIGLTQTLRPRSSDSCVPGLNSGNVAVTATTLTLTFSEEAHVVISSMILTRHDLDGDVPIDTKDKISLLESDSVSTGQYVLVSDLRPGFRYTISMQYTDNHLNRYEENSGVLDTIVLPAVLSCSGDSGTSDLTGRPRNLQIKQQDGYVFFEFIDNSLCEEGFSFSRTQEVDEFLTDFTKGGISFTSDYYYSSSQLYNSLITPEIEASDDLRLSQLEVGRQYAYCVRAIRKDHYMDSPYEGFNDRRLLTSSAAACAAHTIKWEASIDGLVTTESNAGTLPIENVKISWILLSETFEELACDGCNGDVLSNEGGVFTIAIKATAEALNGRNQADIPVRLFFSKSSPGSSERIVHKFLCNNGVEYCDEKNGHYVYLRHLHFDTSLHIFDKTSVPFSGKVTIADTEGCVLPGATICLMHNSTLGIQSQIICGDTDTNGIYVLPVVAGSIVHEIDVTYRGHTFSQTTDIDYAAGIVILPENAPFFNNNFEDISKADLRVEIVGGQCNEQLGKSEVVIKVMNCEWSPARFTQSGIMQKYTNLPAHLMHVEVTNIVDKNEKQIDPIFQHFQGERPIVRVIDLRDANVIKADFTAEKQSIETNTTTGKENINALNEEEMGLSALEEGEEEKLDSVRFQYNGVLRMQVFIEERKDMLDCDEADLAEYGDAQSLHVIDYMTVFDVEVKLVYEILTGLFCDIVDDDLKILVDNQVGIDSFAGNKEFEQKVVDEDTLDLLSRCSPLNLGACLFNVTHDMNAEGENSGNAGLTKLTLATGRPNIISPYTKNIIFKVIGGTSDVAHKAAVFVSGLYSKGPGNSFALPTHEPLMILRDPPGGLSYAKYENVVSTFKSYTTHSETSLKNKLNLGLATSVKLEPLLCAGFGFGLLGPGVTFCQAPTAFSTEVGILDLDTELGGDVEDTTEEKSNEFSTTWSFTTSDDPWTAGSMSDVFVVPNLYVEFEEVYEVFWNNTECDPIRNATLEDDDKTPFPSQLIFSVNSASSKPALSFYSRYHIEFVKLPDLDDAIEKQQKIVNAMNAGEAVCCLDDTPQCPPTRRKKVCTDEEKEEEMEDLQSIIDGRKGWADNLLLEPVTKSIVSWMSGFGSMGLHGEAELALGEDSAVELLKPDVESGLAPPDLIDTSTQLINKYSKEEGKAKEGLEKSQRIQIAGGGTKYEMSLKKERIDSKEACIFGCKVTSATEIKLPNVKFLRTKVFGSGVNMQITPFDFTIEHTSEWKKSMKNTKGTEVSFVLGDPNPGDEFVVDLFYDIRYGSVVFQTIGGRSKCPWEAGTLPQEDPVIKIQKYPSQFVFPSDEMVFELELSNVGVGKESLFALYAQLNDNEGNMEIKVDGSPLFESRVYFSVLKEVPIKKTLTIRRGPRMYVNKPIHLTFESGCMDEASFNNDLTIALFNNTKSTIPNSVTIQLFNTVDENNNKLIRFVEPCPRVEWAGSLSRDRRFVVNTNSNEEQQKTLKVTVFNPDFGTESFKDKTSNRLEHVILYYRRLGEGEANWLPAQIDLEVGSMNLDFAAEYASEDDYGYTTLDWHHGGKEGDYEIMVETMCEALGGPAEIDFYRESILTGVIDRTRPQQYGDPLPLRGDILLGEEVSIVFTEPLDCGRPFSFEITVDVLDTNYIFDLDNLKVICEGRRIGFQIGQVFDPDVLMGKTFIVTIGSIDFKSSAVKDVNGNEMELNIVFERTFADLNLTEASTSFTFTLQDTLCTDATVSSLSDPIRNDIALTLDVSDTSRLQIVDLECHEILNEVIALVNILSSSDGTSDGKRTLLESDHYRTGDTHNSIQLFYRLWDETSKGRRLGASAIAVGKMRIIPSDNDLAKYRTHPTDQGRERELHLIGSLQHAGNGNGNINEFMISEMVNGQRSMKEEMESLHKSDEATLNAMHKSDELTLNAMREEIHALRLLKGDNNSMEVELEGMLMKLGFIMAACAFVVVSGLVHLSH